VTAELSPKRDLDDHKLGIVNERVHVTVLDEPGPGGANHEYLLTYHPGMPLGENVPMVNVRLSFQNGAVAEVGVNGITNEALIAVVMDRLRGFQHGAWKNRQTAVALTKLEEALQWLQYRTRERERRGVEGTMAK
jgi:hypothetical protein